MVRYYCRSRNFLSKRANRLAAFFLIFCCLLFLFNCNSQKSKDNETQLKIGSDTTSKWSDVFRDDKIISFTKDGKEYEFLSFGAMEISSTGDYIIIDGKQGKIFQFDSDGKYIKNIGNQGEGPGEYNVITAMDMDGKNNIYAFDIPAMKINEFSAPNYNFKRQIKIGQPVQDIIATDNDDFILYFSTGTHLLQKINSQGKKIIKTFTPKQERLQLFLSRFSLGRFSRVTSNDFIFIYPDEYKIYFFDNNLNSKQTFFVKSPSKFFPFIGQFPNDLSPYQFSPQHSKWWGKTLHPGRIFYLGNNIFMVILFEYNNLSSKIYCNIHDLDGDTYAVGIELPFEGIVRYAKDGYIYVVENDRIDERGNITPLRLHRFKLKL
ncbi:MAG: 6-bladed beta-propeller [Acidobacteria bacterium]|nr:6-bladed beta-propeller [Acidobacteriota bacterium]